MRRFPIGLSAAAGLLAAGLILRLYGPALHATYQLDDYAWLSLANTLHQGHSLAWALFSPLAQGSIRPLGERAWFLLASTFFGTNPTPMHLLACCVQMLNVALVIDVGRRLLGSPLAASLAALLWMINHTLVEPMVWASAFNQVLFTCLFLAAFDAFLLWRDSARKIWLILHIAAFILALATLELAATLPLILAAYLLLSKPVASQPGVSKHRGWRALIPSSALAAVFVAIHLLAAKFPANGPYTYFLNWRILPNLARYWSLVLGPQEYYRTHGGSLALAYTGTILLSAGILTWAAYRASKRDWIPAFAAIWFVVALAPVLPLLDHFGDYYTFLPALGLAWLAGDAVVRAASVPARAAALASIVAYAACEIPSTLAVRDFFLNRSREVAYRQTHLREQISEIRRKQPNGPVFLSGLDMEQFWWGLCYGELYREGFRDLHIPPDADQHGIPVPTADWCLTPDFQYSAAETRRLLKDQSGQVYDITHSAPVSLPYDVHP